MIYSNQKYKQNSFGLLERDMSYLRDAITSFDIIEKTYYRRRQNNIQYLTNYYI